MSNRSSVISFWCSRYARDGYQPAPAAKGDTKMLLKIFTQIIEMINFVKLTTKLLCQIKVKITVFGAVN